MHLSDTKELRLEAIRIGCKLIYIFNQIEKYRQSFRDTKIDTEMATDYEGKIRVNE